jgi:membrane protease YdiL (CAAX protease family)
MLGFGNREFEGLTIRPPMRRPTGYFQATRHPWPTLLLLLPLLVAYESGILWFGGAKPEMLRNGADAWLRMALDSVGLHQMLVAPALIALIFAGWSWLRRDDRPEGSLGVVSGMLLECFLFALVLWGLSHGFGPFLRYIGITLSTGPSADPLLRRVITFVGAGIYEEILFRLLLFSGLAWTFRKALLSKSSAVVLAAIISALLFAAAHHVGPFGEKMDSYVFLFRTAAGIFFALVYQLRGFGIAVGAHACYDVLVGLSPNS